jgi:hypothetical protein
LYSSQRGLCQQDMRQAIGNGQWAIGKIMALPISFQI